MNGVIGSSVGTYVPCDHIAVVPAVTAALLRGRHDMGLMLVAHSLFRDAISTCHSLEVG